MKRLFTIANHQSLVLDGRSQRKRNLLVRMMLMAITMMMLAPSAMNGATTTMNFSEAAASKQYYETRFSLTQGDNYSAISGAKIGGTVTYRNQGGSGDLSFDISRLAFSYNSSAGIYDEEGSGFYMYAERVGNWYRGLYTGQWNTELAVLNLKPGDKVTFTYSGSTQSGDNANLRNVREIDQNGSGGWLTQVGRGQTTSHTINVSFVGDLIVRANKGTIIQSITIESEVAEYDITTSGNTTIFEFKENGSLEVNDFALPYMSFSMGNIQDYLVVQGNKEVHMYKPNGSETLETGGHNSQPSAGSFYEFKPTGGGIVTMEGSLNGTVHLFVYDPTPGIDTWVELQGSYPIFYKLNFPDPNNLNPGPNSPYYDENWSFEDNNGYVSFSFTVEKDKYYYVCIDNLNQTERDNNYAFHLHKMKFTNTFHLAELAKVIDITGVNDGDWIELTAVTGAGSYNISTKRCSGNISPLSQEEYKIQNGYLYMKKPTFAEGKDNAGTVLVDVKTKGGNAVFVATFPYHADFGVDPTNPNRTLGHTWNFIDPRNSDSNIGNCWINDDGWNSFYNGTTSGILSIGRKADENSQFSHEVNNREWTYSRRVEGSGGTHDPYYMNTFDMVGDNADMIWETEGLWFDTETNLSIIYNESPEYDQSVTNPVDFVNNLTSDPDRYVGLLPDANGKSSFKIPGLKNGDRVLIFMKSGIKMSDDDNDHGIFLNIHGAKDAIGQSIDPNDLYKAGGSNYIGGSSHKRYEGCYHFIKEGDGDMTFDMVGGSMCKLMYIRIYSGDRISTNGLLSNKTIDGTTVGGNLLYMNDKGATAGDYSTLTLHYSGKVQHSAFEVLTYSGNLNDNSFSGDNFKQSGTYEQFLDFTSKVGEIGMFRMRAKDLEYNKKYVADFVDRNFTVGYRDKVDSYPYTWDFTDIKDSRFTSAEKLTDEADNYSAANGSGELDPANAAGYEISLFDINGNMKVHSGVYPEDCNHIFDANKIGFGNQLWAGGDVIPETRGLWFYTDDNDPLYNDCLQITSDGIKFCNIPDADGKRKPWWNYKMVVPDVPANAAVYLRMKRDSRIADTDKMYSDQDEKDVLFLNTRFHFGESSETNPKTSLTEDNEDLSKIYKTQMNEGNYAFYQVPNTTDEYILAVKNTGATNHLTFTLNGWIVEKLAISEDAKTVNRLGWATESRARVIDPALTSKMTGYPFETYIVTDASYANKTVTLSPVTVNSFVMPIAEDGDKNAYIIRNTLLDNTKVVNGVKEPGRVQILNNGFHLFVPDMHDYQAANDVEGNTLNQKKKNEMGSNMLVSLLRAGTEVNKQGSGNIYNYALTSQKNKVGDDTQTYLEEIGFYRIKDGTTTSGNQAYLPVNCRVPTGTTDSGGAKMSIIFDSFDEPVETVETAIEMPFEEVFGGSEAVYYNLNGQKLSGKPTQGGLYIVNGKKVLVK